MVFGRATPFADYGGLLVLRLPILGNTRHPQFIWLATLKIDRGHIKTHSIYFPDPGDAEIVVVSPYPLTLPDQVRDRLFP